MAVGQKWDGLDFLKKILHFHTYLNNLVMQFNSKNQNC